MNTDTKPSLRESVLGFLSAIGGALLALHGVAHAVLAYRGLSALGDTAARIVFASACATAVLAFFAAGLGVAGARFAAGRWRGLTLLGLFASLGAFAMAWSPELWPGLLIDGLIAAGLFFAPRPAQGTRGERKRNVLRQVSTISAVEKEPRRRG